jgi:photosystem I subunit XI|uniref:photosystem I reaction center subunit XI n=1 Tax=Cryptomonas gyropyrenoidosa TaxID=233257 RepID=UPI0027A78F26|nr:photosystem I reaction center subunit XI [Cryptomonas gyropyrenoidosa]WFQ82956.1 photosystem I reaction center subunit XI [Cryptomonas gyropyrenoidosa]
MSNFVKPYNDDPFVGNLATPVSSSSFTRSFLSNLPAYRFGLSPLLRGLEIGIAHGYFLIGPFYKLGPLRNSDIALLSGFFSSIGLVFIMTAALSIYGVVSFEETTISDKLQTAKGWRQFTSGWLMGSIGGCTFAYILISNLSLLQTSGLSLVK